MRRSYKVASKRSKIVFQPNNNVTPKPAHGLGRHPRRYNHRYPSPPDSGKSIHHSRVGGHTARLPTKISSDQLQVSDQEANSQFTRNGQISTGGQHHEMSPVPDLFTKLPPIRDNLNTETSIVQDQTVQDCLPLLADHDGCDPSERETRNGVPKLARQEHIEYLHDSLRDLPTGFVSLDASRPWILYWALTGLSLLGEDVGVYSERYSAKLCFPLRTCVD